jgi:uncharacterized membrane protein YidH (DUF202 family)
MAKEKTKDINPKDNRALSTSEIFAMRRTVMAAESSLKSWASMGISLISFGFGIYEIIMSLSSEGLKRDPSWYVLFMIVMGTIALVYGAADYWLNMRWLNQNYGVHLNKVPLAFGLLMAIFGVAVFLRILARIILM